MAETYLSERFTERLHKLAESLVTPERFGGAVATQAEVELQDTLFELPEPVYGD